MFKPIYEVFVYSLSACFTNWMIILYMTRVKNFPGIYTIEKHSDHLSSFLLQRIISVDN